MAETFADCPDYTDLDVVLPWLRTPTGSGSPAPVQDGLREWIVGPGASSAAVAPTQKENVRWLPPITMVELYEHFQQHLVNLYADGPQQESLFPTCSYDTFIRCYKDKWSQTLRIRNHGMHAKCNACERFKELRRQATSASDSKIITKAYHEHIREQYYDRTVDQRLCAMSEEAVKGIIPLESERSILSCCIDGMDQAKFRCPRNISMAKDFQALWRPSLHVAGAIADGICESYWLASVDIAKDANLQCTLISRLLEQCASQLAEQAIAMPSLLRIHTDNATAEGKNQIVMKFAAWLVASGRFKSVDLTMFRVGHTHNKQDQRFGEVATALSRTRRLEARTTCM